jgi:predicted TIM-barrel fold metal-dependent hydrolase
VWRKPWPLRPAATYAQVAAAARALTHRLSDEERRAVFETTAARVCGL